MGKEKEGQDRECLFKKIQEKTRMKIIKTNR